MLILQGVAYKHSNRDLLFENLCLTVHRQEKIALIGNNGAGKSTLLKIIAGELQPSVGLVKSSTMPYYIPQLFGQFNDLTIAGALKIEDKLKALHAILDGNVTEATLVLLDDDWTIEERCREALAYWKISDFDLMQEMKTLSGGQKTRVFLAGISIHQPEIVLLDEPSNHLDRMGRELLYEFVQSGSKTLIVVSHDRKLLNLVDSVYELNKRGVTQYGGNYDFYSTQKLVEDNAFNQALKSKEKALRKAKEIDRETTERKHKLDARGKKKQEKAGLPTISMNTLRNNAERSASHIKGVHTEKIGTISKELNELRKELPDVDKMRFGFDNSAFHKGKILITAKDINYAYDDQGLIWKQSLNFEIASGERIAINGLNGSGKTTLIKLILGVLETKSGSLFSRDSKAVYFDQDYSLINNQLSVFEQAMKFNLSALQEHEINTRLNRFLFKKEHWEKPCSTLSGGEKMRLMLCCLTIGNQAPDLIILDEPTNNLDIQNIEILTAAINEYMGTLIVISHDHHFLKELNVERTIDLD